MGGIMAKQSNTTRDTRPFIFFECWKAFRRFIKLELLMLNISKGKGGKGSVSPLQQLLIVLSGKQEHSLLLPSHPAPGTGEAQQSAGLGSLLLFPSPSSLWQPQMEKTEENTAIKGIWSLASSYSECRHMKQQDSAGDIWTTNEVPKSNKQSGKEICKEITQHTSSSWPPWDPYKMC